MLLTWPVVFLKKNGCRLTGTYKLIVVKVKELGLSVLICSSTSNCLFTEWLVLVCVRCILRVLLDMKYLPQLYKTWISGRYPGFTKSVRWVKKGFLSNKWAFFATTIKHEGYYRRPCCCCYRRPCSCCCCSFTPSHHCVVAPDEDAHTWLLLIAWKYPKYSLREP